MKKKILVVGGTGYIGSHTTVELQNAGYEVVIIDDFVKLEYRGARWYRENHGHPSGVYPIGSKR